VGAVRAVLAGTSPVHAAGSLDPPSPLERGEVAKRRVGDQDDVAAVAAVAAVGTALGNELLAAEAERAVAALSGLDVNRRTVAEHGRTVAPSLPGRPARATTRGQPRVTNECRAAHRGASLDEPRRQTR